MQQWEKNTGGPLGLPQGLPPVEVSVYVKFSSWHKFTRYFEAGGMEGKTQIDVRTHTILIAYFQTYMYYV